MIPTYHFKDYIFLFSLSFPCLFKEISFADRAIAEAKEYNFQNLFFKQQMIRFSVTV